MSRRRLILPEDVLLPVDNGAGRPDAEPVRSTASPKRNGTAPSTMRVSPLREIERHQILRALAEAEGVQVEAATLLGITPRQLAYRLRKHQIVRSFQPTL